MRRAFTLIELLVVIAIIAILAAMIIAAAGLLRDSAEVLATKQRMRSVQTGLTEAGAAGVDVVGRMQEALRGKELTFASLGAVVQTLKKEHGLDLTDPADCYDHLPPGLATLYDPDIGVYPKPKKDRHGKLPWTEMRMDARDGLWYDRQNSAMLRADLTLDKVILWMDFHDFQRDKRFWDASKDEAIAAVEGTPKSGRNWWMRRRSELRPVADGTERYAWRFRTTSELGETLATTLEVMPDGKWTVARYLEEWPILAEAEDGEVLVQQAWPDSDWNQATPGAVAPVWEMPWGKHVLSRVTGSLVEDQYLIREPGGDERSLAGLSPLANLTALRLAGVLSSEAAVEEYRTIRSRERDHNDRWGNPLLVASALFIAPRYYLDPSGLRPDSHIHDPAADTSAASHGLDREFFAHLLGGRDFLRRTCAEVYGYSESVYLACAALGPRRGVFGDDNPIDGIVDSWSGRADLSWASADDAVVFRAHWLQVTEVCKAEDWRDEAFLDPPWEEISVEEQGSYECLLGAPFELR